MNSDYNYLLKFIIIGNSGVGKSSIMKRLVDNKQTKEYHTTIGVDFGSKIINVKYHDDIIPLKLQIWDTAGQETFKAIAKLYYKNVAGILLCYNISDINSFKKLSEWLYDIRENAPKDVTIILIGNKKHSIRREVSIEEGVNFANEHNLLFMETDTYVDSEDETSSSKSFEIISTVIYQKIANKEILINKDNGIIIKLPSTPPKIEHNCCIIN
jgi:small GTP-binding protein